MKKDEPYAVVYIENGALMYSSACNNVNIMAKDIVVINAITDKSFEPKIIAWCANVIVAPDDNNIIVFNNGIDHGFNIFKNTGAAWLS